METVLLQASRLSLDRLSSDQPINAAQDADSMWFSLSACARLFGQRHSNSGSTCLRGRCVAQIVRPVLYGLRAVVRPARRSLDGQVRRATAPEKRSYYG